MNKNINIDNSLRKLVAAQNAIYECPDCHSKFVKYLGLGEYQCLECSKKILNNYGKVRECIDNHTEPVTINEVIVYTGLTKLDIKRLLQDGSIELTQGGIRMPIG